MSYAAECIFVKYRSCCQACSAYLHNEKSNNCLFVEMAKGLLRKTKGRHDHENQSVAASIFEK